MDLHHSLKIKSRGERIPFGTGRTTHFLMYQPLNITEIQGGVCPHLFTLSIGSLSSKQNSLLIKNQLKDYIMIPMVNLSFDIFKSFLTSPLRR